MALLRSEPRKLNRSFGGLRASLLLALTAGWMGAAQAQSDLVITGIIDAPRSGGLPKAIEIYVINSVADLSIYKVQSYANGGTTPSAPLSLTGSATAGQYLYVASESPGFTAYFGFAPTVTGSVLNVNGDDVVALTKNDTVVDVFGTIGVDPDLDATFNYQDTWFYRKSNTGPSPTFNLADWTFPSGQSDALDSLGTSGVNPAVGNALRMPIGTFTSGSGGTGPTISGFSPSSGAVGTSVTISGSNFSSPTVKFNGTTATITASTATSITATVPAGATSGKITVEVAGQTTATSATDFTVVAAGAPLVTVSPTSATGLTNYVGQVSASTNYTVTGTNLGGTNLVVTASTNAIEVSTNSSTGYTNSFSLAPSGSGTLSNTVYVRISALAPAGAVSATVSNVSGVASNNFTVSGTVTQPALTLVLSPTSVQESAGAGASTGTVGIPAALSSNLVVSLVSSNTAAATVPASVTITNGTTNAIFDIAAVANTNSYAGATAVITASQTNYTSASATLTVQNVDAAPVSTISLTSLATESYTQSFDALGTASIPSAISFTAGVQTSLGAVTGSSTLNGWYATKVGGTGSTVTAITAEAGAGNGGFVYNYGVASASDRALGMLASGSNWMAIGALIKNDTGATINSIKVSFTAEFWRSSTSVQNILTCAIGKVDGSTITTANFLTEPSAIPLVRANITGPSPVSSNGLLDGNAVANQVAFTDVVIPLVLAAGETGFVRWSDVDDAGSDAGLAIDNLRMTASLDLPAADGDGAVSLSNSTPSSPYSLSGIWAAGGSSQKVSVNVTPLLDSTTLTSVSVLVPTEFGVPLVENVASTGGASGGTSTVAGQLITLNGVSITKANPGVINIAGLSTPTTGTIAAGNGVYPFTISTAGDGGTLKAVFASPAANVLIPIANIRDIDANGAPVDKNTIVAVEGICTAAPLGGTSFIQDASYGIAVYPATKAFTLGMVAGHKYAVVGTLVDYNGMAEIKPASVSGVVDLGVVSIPTPITITVAAAKAEQYESMLVTIAGLTKDAAETDPWIATKVITVKDSAGDAIDVSIQSESTATPEPVYPVTITGILQQNSSATPRALTYQIMPRTDGDLSFAPGLRLSMPAGAYVYESNNPTTGGATTATLTVTRQGAATTEALVVALGVSPQGLLTVPASATIPAGQNTVSVTISAIDNSTYLSAGYAEATVTANVLTGGFVQGSITVKIIEDEEVPAPDTTPPVITLIGANPLLLANGATYTDPGATVTDVVDGTRTITGTGTVNTATAGDYTITYNASDAAGNAAIPVTRTVRVAAPVVVQSTYAEWSGGATLDSAGLAKYAIGGASSLAANDGVKPTTGLTDGFLVITAIVRTDNSNLTVVGQAVTDLANYASSTGVTTVNGVETTDQTGVPTGHKRKTFSVAQGSDAKKFMRLIASLALSGVNTTVTVAKDSGGATFLQVTGATAGSTSGGTATSDKRTVYYFASDTTSSPTFSGTAWPYVKVQGQLSAGAGVTATLTKNSSGVLLVNGLPAYQYGGDSGSTTASGVSGAWPAMRGDGSKTTTGPSGTIQ